MSQQLLKAMAVSLKLQETRDAMRQVFGERWDAKKAEVLPILNAVMKRDGVEILAAAQKVARWAMDEGGAMMSAIVLATAVDVIEGNGEGVGA